MKLPAPPPDAAAHAVGAHRTASTSAIATAARAAACVPAEALATVQPAALDIASGAEISPGVKDFDKINSLMSILP